MIVFRILLLVMLVSLGGAPNSAAPPTPAEFTCPVTNPIDIRPDKAIDPFADDASLHYEDGLWVEIPEDGLLELSPDDQIAFGPLEGWRSVTVTWLREDGVEGFIEVTGERLDAESEFSPQTPLSPQRQYVRVGPVQTGLAFPGEGCWEVVGSVASPLGGEEHEITFVVEVRFVEEVPAR